jgi:hypothetical protein
MGTNRDQHHFHCTYASTDTDRQDHPANAASLLDGDATTADPACGTIARAAIIGRIAPMSGAAGNLS